MTTPVRSEAEVPWTGRAPETVFFQDVTGPVRFVREDKLNELLAQLAEARTNAEVEHARMCMEKTARDEADAEVEALRKERAAALATADAVTARLDADGHKLRRFKDTVYVDKKRLADRLASAESALRYIRDGACGCQCCAADASEAHTHFSGNTPDPSLEGEQRHAQPQAMCNDCNHEMAEHFGTGDCVHDGTCHACVAVRVEQHKLPKERFEELTRMLRAYAEANPQPWIDLVYLGTCLLIERNEHGQIVVSTRAPRSNP